MIAVIGSSLKENENRLPIHPSDLKKIPSRLRGDIVFDKGYGNAFHLTDDQIKHGGFRLMDRNRLLRNASTVVLPKPTLEDLKMMKPGALLWGWAHCVQQRDITDIALEKKMTVVAWENMFKWNSPYEPSVHLFHRNNEIAGYASVKHALSLLGLDCHYGNNRLAAVICYGSCGKGSVEALVGSGLSNITIYTRRAKMLRPYEASPVQFRTWADIRGEAQDEKGRPLIEELRHFDIIVNCVLQNPEEPTMFLRPGEEKLLKDNTLIIDVSCDAKMGFPFAEPTSFDQPLIRHSNFTFYGVDHSPSYYWQSATEEVSKVVVKYLPYFLLADGAWKQNLELRRAVEILNGEIINQQILRFQKRSSTHFETPRSLDRDFQEESRVLKLVSSNHGH